MFIVRYYEDEDAIFIETDKPGVATRTESFGDNRFVGYSNEDEIVCVSLLYVSEGVDLDMFTGQDLIKVTEQVEKHNLKVYAA